MVMKKKLNFIIVFALCFFSMQSIADFKKIKSACHLLSAAQIEDINKVVVHYSQLDNGLKVYIVENHRLPLFSLQLVFNVGAADELTGQSGYAHLFEHLMFKGSNNVADGEHFAAIRNVGGNVNASTDYDKTRYWSEAPIDSLDRVLWLEAERLQHLSITQKKLKNQQQAVLEEKLLRIDNVPYFKIASEFMVSAWQGTDYDHLIIGTKDDINRATVKQVNYFFERYYQPDNAILVLVGDVQVDSALQKIKFYFSRINRPDSQKVHRQVKKKNKLLKGKSERHYDPLAPFPLYALGWHTIGKKDEDFYAVELLTDILFKYDNARLKHVLIEDKQLAFALIGMPLGFEQFGISVMGIVPHSYADFGQIKSAVKIQLERIQHEGVSPSELCAVKKYQQIKIIRKMSNNKEMAELIADGVFFFNEPRHAIDALSAYQRVDNQQIKRMAKKYFHHDWLALEIVPGPGMRFLKWFMEILPRGISQSIEQKIL